MAKGTHTQATGGTAKSKGVKPTTNGGNIIKVGITGFQGKKLNAGGR